MTVTLSGVTLRGVSLCPFSPAQLFLASEKGVWYDPSDLGTVYADVAGTTLASVDGPVGKILDKSGNGKHATAAADNTTRPTLRYSDGLYYLEFDGSNDALSTASIDFTATDKMTVWAGVRKISDAVGAHIVDLEAAGPQLSAYIRGPNANGASSYAFRTAGNGDVIGEITGYAAPISNVLTAVIDRSLSSNADVTARINGSPVVLGYPHSEDATGNLFATPLYVGYRYNNTAYFNGRIYSLIVRGAATSTADIVKTETWVNRRTGAY